MRLSRAPCGSWSRYVLFFLSFLFLSLFSTRPLAVKSAFVHIRIQQRSGRKTLTTVQGLAKDLNLKKILRFFKKEFCCNGTIVKDPEMGKVIQVQGDQRQNIFDFLTQENICEKTQVRVAPFSCALFVPSNLFLFSRRSKSTVSKNLNENTTCTDNYLSFLFQSFDQTLGKTTNYQWLVMLVTTLLAMLVMKLVHSLSSSATSPGCKRRTSVTSSERMVQGTPSIEEREGVVRPISPCTNSLMYIPAVVSMST